MVEDVIHPLLSTYTAAPQWVKSTLGKAYAMIPRRVRYGDVYGITNKEISIVDRAAIVRLAADKLEKTLRVALTEVPAYKEYRHLLTTDLSPDEILQRLPVTTKEDIKADISRYLSASVSPRWRLPAFTGGSTAQPMQFYLHKGVTRAKEYAFIDAFHRRAGMRGGEVILALRGRTVPTASRPGGRLWMYEPIKRHLILSSDHLEPPYMPEYVAAMRQWRPRYIQGFPSAIYPLAVWLKEHPEPEIISAIKGVVLYSENLHDYQLQLMRQVFNGPVLRHYGHSERVLMAATMPDDERYFFWPQYGKFELLDPMGKRIEQAGVLGEIVGTSFDNRVMPFVRYRTGDMAVLSSREHPLLPGYPACERIAGRLQEFVVCHDHRLVSITTLGAAHFTQLASADMIQYEQHRPGHIVLKVVANKDMSTADTIRDIAAAVRAKTQGGCAVEVQQVSKIERTAAGKHKMLIQHLDIRGYLGAAAVE